MSRLFAYCHHLVKVISLTWSQCDHNKRGFNMCMVLFTDCKNNNGYLLAWSRSRPIEIEFVLGVETNFWNLSRLSIVFETGNSFFLFEIFKIETFPVKTRSYRDLHRAYLSKSRQIETLKLTRKSTISPETGPISQGSGLELQVHTGYWEEMLPQWSH